MSSSFLDDDDRSNCDVHFVLRCISVSKHHGRMPAKHFYLSFVSFCFSCFSAAIDDGAWLSTARPFYWFNDKVFMINYDNAFQKCIKMLRFFPLYSFRWSDGSGWEMRNAHSFATQHGVVFFFFSLSSRLAILWSNGEWWMESLNRYVQFQNETWPDDVATMCMRRVAATVLQA